MTDRALLRALVSGAIDYAGLFPPAGVGMGDAVRRYSAYRAGQHAWMLGRFIVPAARLEEFVAAFTGLPEHGGSPWRLSVLAGARDAPALAAFNTRYGSRTRIDTVEAPPVREDEFPALAALAATYTVYAEVGWDRDPAPMIERLGASGLRAKIRTGGVTAAAFPPSAAVARFIHACHGADVAFKATAGLHHLIRGEYPLTYEPGSARTTMHGFLNALGSAVAASVGAGEAEIATMLNARNPAEITFDAHALQTIAGARTHGMASFGSCSFEEPVAELLAQELL